MERVGPNIIELFIEIWRSKPDENTKEGRRKRIESLEPGKKARELNNKLQYIEETYEKGIYEVEPNNSKIVEEIEVNDKEVLKKHNKAKEVKKQEGKERE